MKLHAKTFKSIRPAKDAPPPPAPKTDGSPDALANAVNALSKTLRSHRNESVADILTSAIARIVALEHALEEVASIKAALTNLSSDNAALKKENAAQTARLVEEQRLRSALQTKLEDMKKRAIAEVPSDMWQEQLRRMRDEESKRKYQQAAQDVEYSGFDWVKDAPETAKKALINQKIQDAQKKR